MASRTFYVIPYEDSGQAQILSVNTGNVFPSLPTPTRSGYTFGGWQDSSGRIVTPGSDIVTTSFPSQIIAGIWKFMITFDADGGTPNFTALVEPGSSYTITQGAVRGNLESFDGWYYNGNKYSVGSNITPTKSITLVAKYVSVICNITYDANGGTVGGYSKLTVQVATGDTYTLPQASRTSPPGTFSGWKYGSKTYAAGTKLTASGDITFTAVWEDIIVTVKFNANGGSPSQSYQVASGKSFTIPYSPVRELYDFDGWLLNGVLYQEGSSITPTSNIELVAQWTHQVCSVKFNMNGGDQQSYTQTVQKGESVIMPNATKTTGGYFNLAGWLYDGKIYAAGESVAINTDAEFIAQWSAILTKTVTLDTAGGTHDGEQITFGIDEPISGLPITQKEGYVFRYWWGLDRYGQRIQIVEGETKATVYFPIDDKLIAEWLASFTITFDPNGGTGAPPSAMVVAGESYTIPDIIPTKKGNKFQYWESTSGEQFYPNQTITPESSLSLIAIWSGKDRRPITESGFIMYGKSGAICFVESSGSIAYAV